METLSTFWQLDFHLFKLGPYSLSLIEVLVVVFSLMGTYSSRLGWLLTLLANVCFFLFFHQIQLYGLMVAQVILFVFNLVWGIRSGTTNGQPIKKLDSVLDHHPQLVDRCAGLERLLCGYGGADGVVGVCGE
jgi:hypothetical protein